MSNLVVTGALESIQNFTRPSTTTILSNILAPLHRRRAKTNILDRLSLWCLGKTACTRIPETALHLTSASAARQRIRLSFLSLSADADRRREDFCHPPDFSLYLFLLRLSRRYFQNSLTASLPLRLASIDFLLGHLEDNCLNGGHEG